jgi:anti-sigma regulatory factor (Ser/Thr protein kinase)
VAVVGIHDPELASRVAMVVSELATNAIRHAKTAFRLEVRNDSDGVRVIVSDSDPSPPRIMHGIGPKEPSGRGLVIVAALADRWGFHPEGRGKSVWAELDA